MENNIHHFSKEYLARCSGLTPDQILEYIDNYQQVFFKKPEKCRLISLKIEPSLLNAFKQKAKLEGFPYQTKIKELMREWVLSSSQKK